VENSRRRPGEMELRREENFIEAGLNCIKIEIKMFCVNGIEI
jgi:hypothetical protein